MIALGSKPALSIELVDAPEHLENLMAMLEVDAGLEFILIRDGVPVARLVSIDPPSRQSRIGTAKGRFSSPAPNSDVDAEIVDAFIGRPDE